MDILADIGGTKTRIAGTSDLKFFSEPVVVDTPKLYKEGIAAISAAAKRITANDVIESIIAAVRGSISHEKGSTYDSMALPDWSDKPLAGDLQASLGAHRVRLENDMALVGLGEAVYGAGKGASIIVYMTVSTGVNGSRIVDGRIEPSAQGFEIGGQYLSIDLMTTFENLVSGTAIQKRFGMHPKELGKDHPVWEELARTCAFGVHNTILHWSPHKVVLGGSMFNEIGISVERVAEHVKSIMRKFPTTPPIVHSSLGDFGGLWGGLALLNQKD